MARARNIKPAFFKNEDLAELGFDRRLLFIGLWMLADREGRLEDRPKRIKMEIFPGDNVDVDKALADLDRAGFITRYEAGGTRYIACPTFHKHQNPHHRELPSTIPKPGADPQLQQGESLGLGGDGVAGKPKSIPTSEGGSAVLIPDSPLLIPDSGRKAARARATPLPPGFEISPQVKAWAEAKGYTHLEQHLEFFTGRMQASGKTYADWDAALMNCIREDWPGLRAERTKPGNGGGPAWWTSEAATRAKAAELGLSDRSGESWADFRGRINAKLVGH